MRKALAYFFAGALFALPGLTLAQYVGPLPSVCTPGGAGCTSTVAVVNPDGTFVGGGGGGAGSATAANQVTQTTELQTIRDNIGATTAPSVGSTNYLLTNGIVVNTHAVSQSGPWVVSGAVANGAAVGSTFPVTVAGWDGTNVQRLRTGTSGAFVLGADGSSSTVTVGNTASDGASTTSININARNFANVFNGSTWDRARGDTSGAYEVTVGTTAAGGGLAPVVGSLVSNIAGKTSAGNLYQVSITTGAAAVYLYVFNSTTMPADGAVTAGIASGNYQVCEAVAANTSLTRTFEIGEVFTVGIRPAVSSTACGTLTAATTAVFLKSRAK